MKKKTLFIIEFKEHCFKYTPNKYVGFYAKRIKNPQNTMLPNLCIRGFELPLGFADFLPRIHEFKGKGLFAQISFLTIFVALRLAKLIPFFKSVSSFETLQISGVGFNLHSLLIGFWDGKGNLF